MAGRYVMVEFKDPDSANSFSMNETLGQQLGYRVVAVFIKPTKFCECPGSKDAKDWRKGKRTGLYLCVHCRKPSRFHQAGIWKRLQWVMGFNLLEMEWEEQ